MQYVSKVRQRDKEINAKEGEKLIECKGAGTGRAEVMLYVTEQAHRAHLKNWIGVKLLGI